MRNGGERLQRLVDALHRQTLSPARFEVIIADDGSTDGCASDLTSDRVPLRVAAGAPANSYVARNRAARLARAPVLAFCDADCVPESGWLEAGLQALERADVAVGDVRWEPPSEPTPWTLLDIELHLDSASAVSNGKCLGVNLFVKSGLFDAVGGFDETLPSGGDGDFGRRCTNAGARLVFAPGARVRHPTRDGRRALLGKVRRVNRATAVRRFRSGERPSALGWARMATLDMLRSRRRSGKPLGLTRARLVAAGVRASWLLRLRAVVLLYLVVPYVGRAAARAGMRAARREEREARRIDVLLVCSQGGHLLQMLLLREAWEPLAHAWVTLDAADTRSLLAGGDVVYGFAPTTRNLLNLIRNLVLAWRVIREREPAVVLTTGAAIGVPFAWVGWLCRSKVVYVESLTRIERASLSCRLIAPFADRVYIQWPELRTLLPKARYVGSVLPAVRS